MSDVPAGVVARGPYDPSARSAVVRGVVRELRASAPPLIVDATRGPSPSDNLVPSIGHWDAAWRHPTDEGPDVIYWAAPPALRELYDFVAATYELADSVGPQRWPVYRRRAGSVALAQRRGLAGAHR